MQAAKVRSHFDESQYDRKYIEDMLINQFGIDESLIKPAEQKPSDTHYLIRQVFNLIKSLTPKTKYSNQIRNNWVRDCGLDSTKYDVFSELQAIALLVRWISFLFRQHANKKKYNSLDSIGIQTYELEDIARNILMNYYKNNSHYVTLRVINQVS